MSENVRKCKDCNNLISIYWDRCAGCLRQKRWNNFVELPKISVDQCEDGFFYDRKLFNDKSHLIDYIYTKCYLKINNDEELYEYLNNDKAIIHPAVWEPINVKVPLLDDIFFNGDTVEYGVINYPDSLHYARSLLVMEIDRYVKSIKGFNLYPDTTKGVML